PFGPGGSGKAGSPPPTLPPPGGRPPPPAPLAALSLAAVAAAFWLRPRPPDLSGWDSPRLSAELRRLGYRVHEEPTDGEGCLLPTGHPRAVLAGRSGCRGAPTDSGAGCARRP